MAARIPWPKPHRSLSLLDDARAIKILLYLFIGAQLLELFAGMYSVFVRRMILIPWPIDSQPQTSLHCRASEH